MWEFPQYMSGERAFSFSRGTSEMTGAGAGAGAGVGAWTSKTALKIHYKSSSEYLETLVAARRATAMGGFVSEGLAGYLDNLSLNSKDGEKPREVKKRAIEGVTERAMEGRSWRGRPRPQTEVILVQNFF